MPDTYHLLTDDAGSPVVEIRHVERLDLRRARASLTVMDMCIKQFRDRLALLETQAAGMREFLASAPAEGTPAPVKGSAP